MSGPRYVCVHGHFYQPPREDPWSGVIEPQPSAAPYRDWNERITAECYAPNAAARILDEREKVRRTLNNYARMSFNFGPTLLAYLEAHAEEVYAAILRADRDCRAANDGHGSALAQAYSHPILPLATRRDKRTQVRWGIHDFEHRFRRAPEGMWLPETAVDLETLEVLAETGIRFTILAQHQAARIDPTQAYEQRLPSGRSIALFFYDGGISHELAFGRLLERGDRFAAHLLDRFDEREEAQIVHVATDGETYGHHHRFGEMALAWALERLDSDERVELLNYGAFLERHPPAREVEIEENTSWSCSHGVERWRADCGCSTGSHPGWNQAWRTPLREAVDGLGERLGRLFEERGGELLKDPWQARDDYIDVLLRRSEESRQEFLTLHAAQSTTPEARDEVWKLLELQRHAMLASTSCGWFFDDLARVEPLQILRYAGRALQLARELGCDDAEAPFLAELDRAKANAPEDGSGRDLYLASVNPRRAGAPGNEPG